MEWYKDVLGLHDIHLTAPHMVFRAIVAFVAALIYVRVTGIRTLGKQSSFDTITLLMFGAIMGRSVVSESSFVGSLLAALVIMVMHRITAFATGRSHKIGLIIKGEACLLYEHGKLIEDTMLRVNITEQDIREAVRVKLSTEDMGRVAKVYVERSGELSVIAKL